LCASPSIIRVIKTRRTWAGHVARMGEMRNTYRKPEGKRPLGRRMHRWEDNIRKDLRERGWDFVDWMHAAQGRDQWLALVNKI